MRSRTWDKKQEDLGEAAGLETNTKNVIFHLILGVVHLVVLPQHASLHVLHQVPPDGAGCDGVNQVKHW